MWRWGGPAAVAAVVATLWVVLPFVNAHVSPQQPVAAGTVLAAGAGAQVVVPDDGWSVDTDRTTVGERIVLLRGDARVGIMGFPYDGTAEDLEASFIDDVDGKDGVRVIESGIPVETASGLSGRRTVFADAEREGSYTVLVDDGVAIEVLARAPVGSLATIDDELDALVDGLVVVSP
jgi:hypothetical protein